MAGLFERDYSVLTEDEIKEKKKIDSEGRNVGGAKFGRKNFFHKYPKAVRHHMHLFPNNYMDILMLKEKDELERQCDEFENLLNNPDITELNIKRFIQDNRYYHIPASLLKHYSFAHHSAYLFKEFKIGTNYIADYVLVGNASGGHQFVFVEFENPYKNITIADGNFGETIRKGVRQINDWKIDIESSFSNLTNEFKKQATEQLPDEFYTYDSTRMHYVVVAGRRDDFNDKTRRLARASEEDSKIKILHYDNLLDIARNAIGNPTY